jgi:hypothetical protein
MMGIFLNHDGCARNKRIAKRASAKDRNQKAALFESILRGDGQQKSSFPGIHNT